MKFGIPSWWIAASGALLVGLSATLGPVILWHIDDKIQKQVQDIAELESNRQLYWNENGRTDERLARATLLLATANQLDDSLQQLALERALDDASAAIVNSIELLNIMAKPHVDTKSCRENIPDTEELTKLLLVASIDQTSCSEWFASLQAGDVNAFAAVANLRTFLKEKSGEGMGVLIENIEQKKINVLSLRSSRSIWQGVEVFVALLGLLMLLTSMVESRK